MKEIDCRKCVNCDMTNDCCKKYGSDPEKAIQACASDGFRAYKVVEKIEKEDERDG